jgi:hypothetical protein
LCHTVDGSQHRTALKAAPLQRGRPEDLEGAQSPGEAQPVLQVREGREKVNVRGFLERCKVYALSIGNFL